MFQKGTKAVLSSLLANQPYKVSSEATLFIRTKKSDVRVNGLICQPQPETVGIFFLILNLHQQFLLLCIYDKNVSM